MLIALVCRPVPRVQLWVLRLLPSLGVSLVAAGLLAGFPEGSDGWWDRTGFIVNLASGFTAACFGVPLAFFVLQNLLRDREEKRSTRTVAVDATNAITRLNKLMRKDCLFGFDTEEQVREALLAVDEVRARFEAVLAASARHDPPAALVRIGDKALRCAEPLGDLRFRFQSNKSPGFCRILIRYISDHVNATVIREGWDPLDVSDLTTIERYLDWSANLGNPNDDENYGVPDSDLRPWLGDCLRILELTWESIRSDLENSSHFSARPTLKENSEKSLAVLVKDLRHDPLLFHVELRYGRCKDSTKRLPDSISRRCDVPRFGAAVGCCGCSVPRSQPRLAGTD